MKNIIIYYIATGPYVKFFDKFIDSVKNFLPNDKKTVVLLTDSKENIVGGDDIFIKQHYIQHFCWPIVTLFKMKYILDYFVDDCDYAFYINSNSYCKDGLSLDLKKNMTFAKHYCNDGKQYNDYNKHQLKESESFIDYNNLPSDIRYCQGAFFGGKPSYLKTFCIEIYEMIQKDLEKNIIPTWHDESYLNKWLYCNYWMKENKPDYNIVSLKDIVFLEDKGKQFDKFKGNE